jgi:RHS repeat-associated protein
MRTNGFRPKHDRPTFSIGDRPLLRPVFLLCTVLCQFMTLALVPGCGSGNGSDESREVRTQSQSLTPADVLPGKIVPAPGVLQPSGQRQVVGATTGEATVNGFGTMSYDVPIWVPDGVRGMQPQLSIGYRSNGDIGLLGPKWGISGLALSVIKRCRRTLAQDGVTRPIDFQNGDTYCLDGERLLRVSGSVNGPGEFRTKMNPFAKIVAVAASGTGALSFRIFHPDGRILHYGRTDASRLWGNPIIFPNPGNVTGQFLPRQVAAYYVDKIEDRFGNSILVSYVNQPTLPPGQNPPIATQSPDELLPSLIRWGGVGDTPGQRSIQFTYQPPAGGHNVAHQRYFGGLGVYLGQGLTSLKISGPDGLGNVPLLKVYNFSYSTPTITGETLLSQISECDGNNVCKRPTTITWEPGSLQYDSGTSLTSMSDVLLSGYQMTLAGPPAVTLGPTHYRRILVADLNNDGRDDIVYRARDLCLTWYARLAVPGGTFGVGTPLGIGAAADPRCIDPLSGRAPFPGDPIITDINRDGFPDIVTPIGGVEFQTTLGNAPKQATMRAYFNTATGGNTVAFRPGVDFEAPYDYTVSCSGSGMGCTYISGSVLGSDPAVAIGDVDGDALPEIIRPVIGSAPVGAPGRLWAAHVQPCSNPGGCGQVGADVGVVTIPDVSIAQQIAGFAAMDLDGDGIAEILRDLPTTSPSGPFFSLVTSPTMNGTIGASPTNTPFMRPQTSSPTSTRWVLDLNGDGLLDSATIYANDPATIVTNINNGKGFNANRTQTLPPFQQVSSSTIPSGRIGAGWRSGFDNGARVVDYNLDGRDDLVLVDSDPFGGGAPGRTTQVVLLSDGTGGFKGFLSNNIPVGDPADGWIWFPPLVPNTHGYRTSVSLDYNGDDLPDFLQIEAGTLRLYTRQGKKPDMVTNIAEGTGRNLAIAYVPVTDSTVYTPDLSACASDPAHLTCLTGGRLVVKSLTESGDSRLAAQTFKYSGGVYDRAGLGFLGFKQITTYGPLSRRVQTTYDPTTRLQFTGGYTYPHAGRPTHVQIQADMAQGGNSRQFTNRSFEYTFTPVLAVDLGRGFAIVSKRVEESRYDCAPSTSEVGCSGQARLLGGTTDTYSIDTTYGTLKSHQKDHIAPGGGVAQTDRLDNTYFTPELGNWLTGVLQRTQVTSTTSSPAKTVTRTTTFMPDPFVTTTGYMSGEISLAEFEPGGDSSVHRLRTFGRDSRGRVTSVSDADYPTPGECGGQCSAQCNTSCQPGCATSPNPGTCLGSCMSGCMASCVGACQMTPHTDARTTGYRYDDNADGVYVTTTTDAMLNETRVWRHVGLGLVVQTDNENGAPTKYTYDSFGRPLSETAASGESMTYVYDDTTGPSFLGANVTLRPGGSSQRAVAVRLDPFGNATSQTSSINSTRTLTKTTTYDNVGRVAQTRMISKTGTVSTTLNTNTLTFDAADRVVSDCHLTSSDGASHCKINTYDGLSVNSVNESGRTSTTVFDSLGRLSMQRAAIASGLSTATFVYGPFDLLERESVEDSSGFMDIAYDVLGRPTSVTRKNAGTRRTTYNAFGDITSSFKLDASGATRETVTYGRDKLGRITTMQSPGAGTGPGIPPALNREFFWDHPAVPGSPFTRGRLNDVVDSGNETSVHFEYNAAGQVLQKRLTLFNPAIGTSGTMETFTASFTYDTQGRIDTLTYPRVPTETQPFAAKYAYDSFTGTPSSIRDAANLTTAIWSATGRNELGQLTNESMRLGTTTTITRTSSYFLQDGRLRTASIGTSSSRSQLDYTYQSDGLPRTFARSGVGGSSTATYDNDNLGRLISWRPASGAPTVTYGYDSDGNLLSRNWSGETVTYGTTMSGATMAARTVTTKRGTQAAQTDTYATDGLGRIVETPAVTMRMTDDSKIGSVTQKANGQLDTLLYDGLGNRVLTLSGTRGSAGSLLEFDDLFELKRDGTNSTAGTEGRCRLRAGDRLIGDVVRRGTSARTATFYLEDNVHSIVAEATSGGTVTARQRRDPFGNSFTSSTTPFLPSDPTAADPDGSSRLGFGSHDRDRGWGLVDMRARAYSPRLGRFTSPDLIMANPRDRREFNPFAYVQNSPTAKFDPLGLSGGGATSGGPSGGGGRGGGGHGGPPGGSGGGSSGGSPGGGKDGGAQNASSGSSGAGRGESGTSGTPGGGDARGAAYQAGAAQQANHGGAPSGWNWGGTGAGGYVGPRPGPQSAGGRGGGAEHVNFSNSPAIVGNAGGHGRSGSGATGGHSGTQGSPGGGPASSGPGPQGPGPGYGGPGGSPGGGWSGGIGGGNSGAGGMGGNPGSSGGTGYGTWGGPFNSNGRQSTGNGGEPTGGGLVGYSGTVMAGPVGASGGAYLMIDNNYGLSIMLTYASMQGLGFGAAAGAQFGLFSGPPEGQSGGSNGVCVEGPGVSASVSQSTGSPYGSAGLVGVQSPTIMGAMMEKGETAVIGLTFSTFD